jgi:hypothetical protein
MNLAALITWLLTAGGGFVLLSVCVARGGMRRLVHLFMPRTLRRSL